MAYSDTHVLKTRLYGSLFCSCHLKRYGYSPIVGSTMYGKMQMEIKDNSYTKSGIHSYKDLFLPADCALNA